MHQTKKGNQWHFGMKCHTGMDAGSGFVHMVETTAANVHDIPVAAELLREDDEVVYGDSVYLGLEKREEIKQNPRLSAIEYRINLRLGQLPKVSNKAIDWEEPSRTANPRQRELVYACQGGRFPVPRLGFLCLLGRKGEVKWEFPPNTIPIRSVLHAIATAYMFVGALISGSLIPIIKLLVQWLYYYVPYKKI